MSSSTNPTTSTKSSSATIKVAVTANVTGSSPNSTTTGIGAVEKHSQTGEIAISVIVSIIVVVALASVILCILKKFGKRLPCCVPTRKRRSSTSSSRAVLADEMASEDVASSTHRPNEKLKQATDEMFTIDDFEEDEEREGGRGDGDGYFYDEVFGRSEFEDEVTQNSVRQLYSNHEDGEMLDLDFETLGISADQFSAPHLRIGQGARV